jgi:hypothetical protein
MSAVKGVMGTSMPSFRVIEYNSPLVKKEETTDIRIIEIKIKRLQKRISIPNYNWSKSRIQRN